jgi:Tfp pilus assembly protein PilV
VVNHARQRGIALLEVTIALIAFAVLLSWALAGNSGELRHAAASFEQTRAERLAAGRLEALRPDSEPLPVGLTAFALPASARSDLADPEGEQVVREIEPGLFEVSVTVRWGPRQSGRRSQARLVTLIERRTD